MRRADLRLIKLSTALLLRLYPVDVFRVHYALNSLSLCVILRVGQCAPIPDAHRLGLIQR